MTQSYATPGHWYIIGSGVVHIVAGRLPGRSTTFKSSMLRRTLCCCKRYPCTTSMFLIMEPSNFPASVRVVALSSDYLLKQSKVRNVGRYHTSDAALPRCDCQKQNLLQLSRRYLHSSCAQLGTETPAVSRKDTTSYKYPCQPGALGCTDDALHAAYLAIR